MALLTADTSNPSSMVSSIATARENASQVREQISSEMWERLNQLYHETTQSRSAVADDSELLRLINAVREGSYTFYGVTDSTMSHGEGWHFIHLGRSMERACALSGLIDAYFSSAAGADDLDWVGLLSSCSAFEAYCKVYTADLASDRVAEFLLLNAEFPYTVRYSADAMHAAIEAIAESTSARKAAYIERIIGRLQSSLAYAQIDDIIGRGLHQYLNSIIEQCRALHFAVHEVYIEYPIETALEA
jgi:uncharacterized alpha-E superfamily protein